MAARKYVVIALISLTLLPLELTWTRIFSAEFFYTFAFLVLSLAILGLGLGALALRLFRRTNSEKLLGLYLALCALCALAGPILVFRIGVDLSALFTSWPMVGKLLLTVLILMSAYFFGGMALAMLFKRNVQQMPKLYMADLLGAGLGVVLAIWAMNRFGTPAAAFYVALPILFASLLESPSWTKLLPVGLGVVLFLLLPSADGLLEQKREERAPVIFSHWDAMSKIKIYHYDDNYRGLNIDNVANSPVNRFDGKWATVNPDSIEWPIDVSYLIRRFDSCVFLSLGAGGGSDVLQALTEGATEVHAVEVNPYINHMMVAADTMGYLPVPPPKADSASDSTAAPDTASLAFKPAMSIAEFSGYIYRDPRVKVITEDGRSYIRRYHKKFDIIYSLSSNTWAALASGAFALAENYLFTTEAFEDYWQALSDSGFLMMEHQVYVPRLVSEVREALTRQGVANPDDHFAVYDLPKMRRKIILLAKQPLTDDTRSHALGALTPENFDQRHLLYPPANDSIKGLLLNRIIREGWQAVADTAPIDISPVSDDRPFVAQLGRWKNFTSQNMQKVQAYAEFAGFPLSKLTMVVIFGVVLLVMLPLNLLPYLTKGAHLSARPWLYFFCIGVGFMAVEVVLIQKYTLLIGASLYSIVTILLTLLTASGIGSRFADRVPHRITFIAIIGLILLDALAFRFLTYAAGGWALWPRILLTICLVAPVGFFMGMPFPKAALRVGELIDWGFAVNGAASVLGSVLVLMIAIAWGFTAALFFAALMYAGAYALFHARWTTA